MITRIPTLLLFLALPAAPAPPAHITVAGHDVAVWKPEVKAPSAGYPVVVFSHGFTGCNTQSAFLMDALAHAGYLVVAPNHDDARCGSAAMGERSSGKFPRPDVPFQNPERWSDATYQDRRKDIESLLDALLSGTVLQGTHVDAKRIGIAGHSLGGYTALGVAGAWQSWKDQRIKAVLALSPYCTPYLRKGGLGQMNVPVMYQGGTRDFGITPSVKRPQGAYDRSSPPKYFIEFEGAGHLAWTNLNKTFQETISNYSIAFFDHFLRGKTNPDPLAPLIRKPFPKHVIDLRVADQ